jgi:hypothetical protein
MRLIYRYLGTSGREAHQKYARNSVHGQCTAMWSLHVLTLWSLEFIWITFVIPYVTEKKHCVFIRKASPLIPLGKEAYLLFIFPWVTYRSFQCGDHMAPAGRMVIDRWRIGRNRSWSNRGTFSTFGWKGWGKRRKSLVHIALSRLRFELSTSRIQI